MVKTRGVKRATTYCEYDLDAAERLEDEDLWFAEEEENAAAKKPKPKQEVYESTLDATFDVLPPEILPRIVSYLDCRGMLHLASCSKSLRSAVTPEAVIRAAVFGDKQSQKVVTSVMDLVQRQAIHTPSTFRLLRLLNGTRCERGTECWAGNRVTNRSSVLTTTTARPFGLCICNTCKRFVSSTNIMHWRQFQTFERDRVAIEQYRRVLSVPQVERATGAPVGSILLGQDLTQIQRSYQGTDERHLAMDEIFQRFDETLPASEHARREMLVDTFIAAKTEYEARTSAKAQLKWEQYKARAADRAARKRESGELVLATMETLLSEYPHKEIVLAGEWSEATGIRHFTFAPSCDILGPLLNAPSSVKPKSIPLVVDEVREAYTLLLRSGFGTGTTIAPAFLSGLEHSEEPLDIAVYKYRHNLEAVLSPRDFLRGKANRNFIQKLRENGPAPAIYGTLNWHTKEQVFLHSVAEEGEMASNFKLLAEVIWSRDYNPVGLSNRAKFQECTTAYQTLAANMKAYLQLPLVRRFLAKPTTTRPLGFTRLCALERIFMLKHDSRFLLRRRNFTELLALHKRIYRDPHGYFHGWDD